MMDVSSMSGYMSFSNSKAQPLGSRSGACTAQSPLTLISSLRSQRTVRWSTGWSGGTPESSRPRAASAVSQTGERQAWTRREAPSSLGLLHASRNPWSPLAMTGMVVGVPELMQGYERVDPRGLDAAPGAVGLLVLHDPALRLA